MRSWDNQTIAGDPREKEAVRAELSEVGVREDF